MPGQTGTDAILPTPMLLSVGHKITEAYEETPATDEHLAVWRVRDDSYDKPGTVYRRVTVERIPTVFHCEHCGREWIDYTSDGAYMVGPVWDEYAKHECDYNLEGGLA
jgi:hypothetical protein